MPIMSDAIYGQESEPPYDVPRGTCPECGRGAVRHYVAGPPGTPEWAWGSTPEWDEGVGCLVSPLNRAVRLLRRRVDRRGRGTLGVAAPADQPLRPGA